MRKNYVSIIIPCYNDGEFVKEAINSAFYQTYFHKEIIVVDDGSDKKTQDVLKNLKPKVDKLITQQNKGTGAARNRGIEAAKGEYILILDADDYFESEFCEKAITVFNGNYDCCVVTCWARWFWNNRNYDIFKPTGGTLEDYLLHNAAIGTSMFKKEDWASINGYDENMQGYEDWEFFIRLHINGGRTYVLPEALFNYRKKRKSRNRKANLLKYELLEYIYMKHATLYKDHFDTLLPYILKQLQLERNNVLKREKTLDFRIGYMILKPLRYIKYKAFKF